MPNVRHEEPLAIRALELSEIDRANIKHLIGHTLARLERELILQTLQNHQGNRTTSATVLGISVRCLRNKIRVYKRQGESVPEPQTAFRIEPEGRHGRTQNFR